MFSPRGSTRKKRLGIRAGVAVVLGLASCAALDVGPVGAASAQPYRVLYIGSLSGPLESVGQSAEQGLKAGVAVVNSQGGLQGRKVTVTVVNDQGDPTNDVAGYEKYVSSSGQPDLVVNSSSVIAVAPATTPAKVLTFGIDNSAAANQPKKWPYTFLVNSALEPQGEAMAQYLVSKNVHKAAYLYSTNAFGEVVSGVWIPILEKHGISVVGATYNDTDLSMTSQLQKLKASNPEMLLLSGYGAPTGYIMKSKQTVGWNIPTLGDGSFGGDNLESVATADQLKNMVVQQFNLNLYVPPSQRTAQYSTMLNALNKQGKLTLPLNQYAHTYDTMMLIQMAAKQGKTTTTEGLTSALNHLHQSAHPTYQEFKLESFTPNDHLTNMTTKDVTFVPPGAFEDGTFKG
jgi:branched-chain amino acid transport system substrate-binding protein